MQTGFILFVELNKPCGRHQRNKRLKKMNNWKPNCGYRQSIENAESLFGKKVWRRLIQIAEWLFGMKVKGSWFTLMSVEAWGGSLDTSVYVRLLLVRFDKKFEIFFQLCMLEWSLFFLNECIILNYIKNWYFFRSLMCMKLKPHKQWLYKAKFIYIYIYIHI